MPGRDDDEGFNFDDIEEDTPAPAPAAVDDESTPAPAAVSYEF